MNSRIHAKKSKPNATHNMLETEARRIFIIRKEQRITAIYDQLVTVPRSIIGRRNILGDDNRDGNPKA